LDEINSTLVPALIQDKESAQRLHDIAYDAVEKCKTTRTETFDGAIANKDQAQQDAETAFDNCKAIADNPALLQQLRKKNGNIPVGGAEGCEYGYNYSRQYHDEATAHALGNTTDEAAAAADYKAKCKKLDDYVKTFKPKEQKQDWCEDPAEGADWSDVFRTNTDMWTKSYEWFHYMDQFTTQHAAEYKKLREECHEARHRHKQRVEECHTLQHKFEADYCSFSNKIDETCNIYENCYSNTYAEFEKQNASVAEMEVQFKAQQYALECLLCYGDQILEDKTDLSVCDDTPCENCEDLCLDYKVPHPECECDEELPDKPCEDSWVNKHYGEYTRENCIPVDTCVPCEAPVLVGR